ncbi:RNA-binding S4 domain-containing protein [Frigidibacter oleivorans]|uniref:RNA-binding S4 domain-containing protein n=1 Tax=Frigidibacter oleivorans TaxID=2487129 RepID=UPI000F8E1256|nr:RNA-binding S4 domain-containing protein [Frigidibacter oleivorans]
MTARGAARPGPAAPGKGLRLDKWLFFARFAKSRSIAVELIEQGAVRLNGTRVSRASQTVDAGDTLTLAQGGRVRVIRVLACGTRRGPATEAALLWRDLEADPAEGAGI